MQLCALVSAQLDEFQIALSESSMKNTRTDRKLFEGPSIFRLWPARKSSDLHAARRYPATNACNPKKVARCSIGAQNDSYFYSFML